jgi:hemerythrin superfamily protein
MKDQNPGQQNGPTIRKVYPTLTKHELKEAEANFRRYVEIAGEIQRAQVPVTRTLTSRRIALL